MAREIMDTPAGPAFVPEWKQEELDGMTDADLLEAHEEVKKRTGFVDPFLVNEIQHRRLW